MIRFNSFCDAISRISILAVFALLPFFVVPVAWMTTEQSKVALMIALLSIAALGWVIARVVEGTMRVPAGLILAGGVLLPLAYLVSTLTAGITSVSLFGTGIEQDTLAAAGMWYAALALSMFVLSEHPLRGINALRALFFGGFILLALQIVHQFFPAALPFGGAATWQNGNLFGSWHDLGILLGLFVFAGAALKQSPAREGVWRFVFAAVVAVSLVVLVMLNLPDVWIGLAVVSTILLVRRVMRDRAQEAVPALRPHTPLLAVAIIAVFFSFLGGFVNNVLPATMRISSVEIRPSWQGTLQISQQVLVHPATLFFGAGPNTFTHEWGLYKPVDVNTTQFWNTTFTTGVGSIPTSFITVGVLGLIAWAVLLIALLLMTWVVLFRKSFSASPYQSVAETLALSSLFLIGFFVLYVPGPALSVLSFLVFGLFSAFIGSVGFVAVRTWSIRQGWQGIGRMAGVLALGLVVAFASAGVGRVLASETMVNRGIVMYNNSGDIARASDLVGAAIRMSPESDRAQRAAVELGILQLRQLAASADPKDEKSRTQLQTTLSQTIQHGLDAVSINSDDYQNWLSLAGLYGELAGANVQGAYENARAAYTRAQAANPTNPLPLLQMAQLELLQNNTDAALQDLAAAVQLKQDFAPAYYLASQVYASKNDFKNAIPTAAQAVQYAQNDPLGWYNLGLIAYGGEDFVNAATALERAVTLDPQYANAMYVLGLTYYKQNSVEDATRVFTALNKLDPSAQAVVQILQDLRDGKPLFQETASSAKNTPVRK